MPEPTLVPPVHGGVQKLLRRAGNRAARMPLVAQTLFGVRFAPLGKQDYIFDITTIALFGFLTRTLSHRSRLLDMGTGAAAVLGLAVWRRVGCHVISSDVHPELVASARRNVAHNRAPIEVVHSRFFDSLDKGFDVVSFNAPYVPTSVGETLGITERRVQWDGGIDGTAVIAQYLDAVGQFSRPITSYLGVNRQHVNAKMIDEVFAGCLSVALQSRWLHPVLPVDIYTIASGSNGVVRPPS